MIDALLERASSRFVFVVGKGGVGKSTTAGALALAFADRDIATHLISTDPAHSLGDLFRQTLAGGAAAPSQCNARLLLEEFAARPYADRVFAELRDPLIELIERGTYLDVADAKGFVDLSIPGIDEVMSALRLVELAQSDRARIVVDTAPTGHTVRLLDSGRMIDSWVDAGGAMAEKAGVVAAALVGRAVPMRAEALLADWRAAARRFENDILRSATAIVVTRPGHVVAAETERLVAALRERGVSVGAMISVGEASGQATFVVEQYPQPQGCAGVRAWQKHLVEPHAVPHPVRRPVWQPRAHALPWITALPARMLWIGGKGGVGKSTCAASIACALAEQGSVCVVSTDPAGSLSEVFGAPVGTQAAELAPRLFARQIDAVGEFNRMRAQYRDSVNEVFASLGLEGTAQLDRKVIEALWDFAPPGIDEIISLIEILEHAGDFDRLIVDSAPTGHFLRLLEMPELALDWVHQLLRLLVKYGAVASLDALAHDLLAFAKRLRQLKLDLSTPGTTAVFVVTLAQPLVNAETERLSTALDRAGVPVAAMILNRADDGERSPASGPSTRRRIRTPDLQREIVGPAALRSFIGQWELIGE